VGGEACHFTFGAAIRGTHTEGASR
jgi:hypothetical protein